MQTIQGAAEQVLAGNPLIGAGIVGDVIGDDLERLHGGARCSSGEADLDGFPGILGRVGLPGDVVRRADRDLFVPGRLVDDCKIRRNLCDDRGHEGEHGGDGETHLESM